MAGYSYLYGCGGSEAVHSCHDCPDGRVREFAGARQSGFIKESYLPTLLANPLSLAAWETGVADGFIVILPHTRGSYDPGEPKELKGYGNRKVEYGPRTMTLQLFDPDYEDNYHFYNEIALRKDFVPFFCTSSLIRIFDKVAIIKAKDPVAEDIDEEVTWQVDCQVISENLPIMVKKATLQSVFTCANF